MKNKLCPKCGRIAYYDSYFQKYKCNTCHHMWKENPICIIKTKLINTQDPIFLPFRKHSNDAGADLRARIDHKILLQPSKMVKIPTGIAVEIPDGYVGDVRPRSGAASEGKMTMYGTIDCGFRGEISLNVLNVSDKALTIEPKERLAQLVVLPYLVTTFEQVDELSESERGTKGFGSSGKM